jgi:two-component system NtrC family sensor kinase
VAHELNNPLTGVIGYAQLLRDGCGPEELERNLERIQEEARRCHRIVQNLLAFSRKRRPQRLPVDVHRVLEETLDLRAYQMRVDNIWLVKDFEDDLPVVEGDAHQLQQVFMNLVTNAHQALAASGKGGVLTVATRAVRGFVEVRVSDNGPGIPDRIRRRIFEPFFTTKAPGQGTGLGLSICHGIVTGHGGRLSVSSRPGVETTFVVEIPTGAADALRAAAPAPEQRKREPSRERSEIREAPRRVLVVDDEESIREFLEEALQARGHEVDTAANGLMALDRLRSARYDAVITDLKMPGMNGRQLFESIRREEPELARRVIFATGDLVAADTMEFLRGTGNTYLEKPFSLRSIAEALDQLESGEG